MIEAMAESKNIIKRKTVTKVTIDKIVSVKVSAKRFQQMKSGRHFEFNKVKIPLKNQHRLKIGDTIYANGPDDQSKALEFLTMDKQDGYEEDQVDIIVKVL